ncbi:hypothetical protein T552_01442 [Pneumocystis carinii B80]|uniref:Protein mgr2 n=1 Tax=Pneumocystis carinii (strain B80) TaxID=1408658 RepID=A0A0W4ZKB3_PNEC8|nr:hypothetical protein T552_01442 [Pneumocystis carinii B80]KTW28812.1 hypothetical protein T552_01442 [Pneumocystis carinii B80]
MASTLEKLKTGALMGSSVGLCGTLHLIRYGPGRQGVIRTLSTSMISSAATFGFFMAIGTVIRTETLKKEEEKH